MMWYYEERDKCVEIRLGLGDGIIRVHWKWVRVILYAEAHSGYRIFDALQCVFHLMLL